MNTIRSNVANGVVVVMLLAGAGDAQAAPGDVQAVFDLPCKYPAGLASDGAALYLADWREAELLKIDPDTGAKLGVLPAPALDPQGLGCGGDHFFVGDGHTGWIYVFEPGSGMVRWSFEAPGSRVRGVAYGAGEVFILEGRSRKIYRVVPSDGTIAGYYDEPARGCGCMTYDGKYLWVANRLEDEIYMLEPKTGQVINILPSPGPYPAGIAWHDDALCCADFQTRKLYKLATADDPPYRLDDERVAQVEYLWVLSNYGPGEVRELEVGLGLPMELPHQHLLGEVELSGTGWEVKRDRWGQRCAVSPRVAVPSGSKKVVSMKVPVRVHAIRYFIDPDRCGTLADIAADVREAYTVDGERYRIASPYMETLARKIVGDEENPYWIARKIYDYLIDHLEYEMVGGWDVPEVVLKRGTGSCSEYTFCFIALCRAAGLPARYQGSVVVRGDDASVDESFHRWAQVYLPNYGWVPVDANRGDKTAPADQARGFGGLANRFLITTQGGGASEYLHWGYNSHASWQATGYCKIEQDNLALWEPLTLGDDKSGANADTEAESRDGR